MELTHDFTVPAPLDETWATFMDLRGVGSCFPGAVVTAADDEGFSGTVKVKLGPIALQYAGAGTFLERDDAAHRAVIEAKGKDKRGNGTAGATVTVQLAPSGEGTRVDVTTDLSITGKPAQFGRGVMQDVSDKLLQQFVACIERHFAPEAGAPAAQPAATSAAPQLPSRRPRSPGERLCPSQWRRPQRPCPGSGRAPHHAARSTSGADRPGAGRRLDRPRRHRAARARQELRAVCRSGPGGWAGRLAPGPPRLTE